MAIVPVQNLLQSVSREQALSDLLVLARAVKFTGSSFRIGSRHRFWMVALAEVASRCTVQIALIAGQGFNATAFGNALSKFSNSRFDNPRIGAIKTQGTITLTDTGGTGPHTIGIGTRVFKFDDDPSITYRNITGGTVPLSGSVDLTIEAETGGSAWNVDTLKISSMSPVIAGVDVSNPGTGSPAEWITRAGVDGEADPTLQTRNTAKWAALGGNAPRDAYRFWALSATTNADGTGDPVGISRVAIDDQNPDGPGTLRVYVADETGTASGGQVTDVQEYIDARRPRTALSTVVAASTVALSIVGTFRCPAGLGVALKAAIESAVADYVNGVDIGGTDIGATFGVVVWSRVMEIAQAVDGVTQVSPVTLDGAAADFDLQAYQIALPTVTFTAIEI